jgi:hypothetical protein
MAQQISQSEIRHVNELEHTVDALCFSLRRRLQAGATVEPGQWTLSEDGSAIEQFETRADGGSRCGLDIEESTAPRTAPLMIR